MGWAKKLRKIGKTVTKPVTKVVQKATSKGPLKTSKKFLRKVAAVSAPFTTGGVGLFVQPKVLGIKNKSSAKLFDKSQQVTRIAVTVGAAVAAAPVVGAAVSAGASAVGAGISSIGVTGAGAAKAGMALLSHSTEPKTDKARTEKLSDTLGAAYDYLAQRRTAKAERPDPTAVMEFAGDGGGLPSWALPALGVGLVVVLFMVRK